MRRNNCEAVVKKRYSLQAFDSILEHVNSSAHYTVEEKEYLSKMLAQMKREDWLLYMVEIYKEEQFCFSVPNFPALKEFLIAEVYNELINQLIDFCKEYEDVGYNEIRDWFHGMTFDIKLINLLDQRFNEIGVRIRY